MNLNVLSFLFNMIYFGYVGSYLKLKTYLRVFVILEAIKTHNIIVNDGM